jgi:SAM-dependent methyltransferase
LTESVDDLRAKEAAMLDCIVGLDFYEHLEKERFLDFLAEAARVLKPSGRLILRGPNGDSPVLGRALYNDITHVTAHTTIGFKALLEMSGFKQPEFRDDALASITRHRWFRIPLAWSAQQILRLLIRLATRENIPCLSASIFISAVKRS